jgi:excinuclease ABC subunit B
MVLSLRVGMEKSRNEILRKLVDIQFTRNDIDFSRGTFRVRGDVIEIFSASSSENAFRIEMFGDEIERITEINVLTGEVIGLRNHVGIFPASHYVTKPDKIEQAIHRIEEELEERIKFFKDEGKLVEAQRIEQRTRYDIEMLREVGFCQGIENYSRIISNRKPGSRPFTLIDYFPDDFLLVVDEAHVTLPQVRGMFGGDRSRKTTLIDYGFRLPSAFDNRPLNFPEFETLINQALFVSATPGPYEREHSSAIVEQVIRPTGLLDPQIEVRPITGQIDDLFGEINKRIAKKERVLVTTLTKRMAEDLTDYLKTLDIKVRYMHSDIETLERMKIIRDLRTGEFDVLVGINLLREGLDLPEVSLVTILDADKEGFLRSETALTQTVGRASRHVEGTVIMYADKITRSMRLTIDETNRRRIIQEHYNTEHGIIPTSIVKDVREIIEATKVAEDFENYKNAQPNLSQKEIKSKLSEYELKMFEASTKLDFEKAIEFRDLITRLNRQLKG